MAERESRPHKIQHHVAHLFATAGEYELNPPFLGIIWDGTGYGPDNTIWGGEFLLADREKVSRVGHLQQFKLPGGEKAVKEPSRVALGLLWEVYGQHTDIIAPLLPQLSESEINLMLTMCHRGLNCPRTSSMGRLFDGVAALCGFSGKLTHEGMAAIWLENLASQSNGLQDRWSYKLKHRNGKIIFDWRPMIEDIAGACISGKDKVEIAARFHNTLIAAAVELAGRIDCQTVLLGGGCFQNRTLYSGLMKNLERDGFSAYAPQEVPPGDGGIAYGQIHAAGIPLIHEEMAESVVFSAGKE